MDGESRRQEILSRLLKQDKAISATAFANEFGVSRQIIVGDIALLRASGQDILATSKGYVLNHTHDALIRKVIAVSHTTDQTEIELLTLVKHGAIVENVIIEHPLYGEITGGLNIRTQEDVKDFLSSGVQLLSGLTEGLHLHTIYVQNEADYDALIKDLEQLNILYRN
ncbi:transcription repressor NadR [Erysipelothrix inopinata]|uniref:Transcription repressor NadR n=1 Tax=Erysipelothrix inopinata TaxID=225084 RepID=A0A7G9RZT1_9FIRM|nr:transcription repressor NadR [Erysipelothrix inopinata]QNN61106.1 transcription repressor NadR [Erysipelothrix inopinata]